MRERESVRVRVDAPVPAGEVLTAAIWALAVNPRRTASPAWPSDRERAGTVSALE